MHMSDDGPSWIRIIDENSGIIWGEVHIHAARSGMDPDDLRQDAMLSLWTSRDEIVRLSADEASRLIRVIVRRRCIDACRRETRHRVPNYGLEVER